MCFCCFDICLFIADLFLQSVIKKKYGQDATNVGDEGGFAPNIQVSPWIFANMLPAHCSVWLSYILQLRDFEISGEQGRS